MTTVTIDTSSLVERPTVFANTTLYNVAEIQAPNVATLVAGGAGQTVVTTIAFGTSTAFPANYPTNANYTITGTASQACAMSYSSKTTTGFVLTLTPLSGSITLAAGTVDLVLNWQNGGDVQ